MRTMTRFAILLGVAGLSLSPTSAQSFQRPRQPLLAQMQRAEIIQLYQASAAVRLEITLDRQEYLAGESNRATLAAFNPTQDSLLVFDPFESRGGCIDTTIWNQGAVRAVNGGICIRIWTALGIGTRQPQPSPSVQGSESRKRFRHPVGISFPAPTRRDGIGCPSAFVILPETALTPSSPWWSPSSVATQRFGSRNRSV